MDTAFFRLREGLCRGPGQSPSFQTPGPVLLPKKWVEVDLPQIVNQRKASKLAFTRIAPLLSSHACFHAPLSLDAAPAPLPYAPGALSPVGSDSPIYHLTSGDLRNPQVLQRKLIDSGVLDSTLPTLLVSECVLVYLPAPATDQLLRWATQAFSGDLCFAAYEHATAETPFGRQMLKNLRIRGIHLPGLLAAPTLEAQQLRYGRHAGFDAARTETMLDVYNRQICPPGSEEERRVLGLDVMPDPEEWDAIMGHYSLTFAIRGEAAAALIE
eukprot:gnl/Ergobibamus_cyprinoides/1576.p1 GENE.gnl/Ergobibamus_cyprinoides/1576~~gnl/Ergobibamus_cyprinoides/1576.p1  ORF type:complete len:270 (+),score=36.02 gnl/Ergobibamus_cyprinoides/1576:260-1069(+)